MHAHQSRHSWSPVAWTTATLFSGISEGLMIEPVAVRSCRTPPLAARLVPIWLLVGYSALRPQNAGAARHWLPPARRTQGCQLPPWSIGRCREIAVVPSWPLSSYCRCSWAKATLHREPSMCRYTDPQQLRSVRWQNCCSFRPRTMEQFTITYQRCGLTVQSVPAITKDILFG